MSDPKYTTDQSHHGFNGPWKTSLVCILTQYRKQLFKQVQAWEFQS